ncbi:MAG TPA: hypothetical protein VGP93_18330, partial [Polyangiaceae bacterium]|nr:hypothetical protein [Polyangiaceae bacterium]
MSQAPKSPELFFSEYVPARVARLSSALSGKDSPGSVAFSVLGAGTWWLRLKAGVLEVSASELPDLLLTIALRLDDFASIIVTGADQVGEDLAPERQIIAARMLTLDSEHAKLVRSVPGSLGLLLSDGAVKRRLLVSPCTAALDLDHPSCEIACTIQDFWAMQAGSANAFEL